jgi:hypothetical protein
MIANFYWRIGSVLLLESRTGDAVLWLGKAGGSNPRNAAI